MTAAAIERLADMVQALAARGKVAWVREGDVDAVRAWVGERARDGETVS
jgi:hypothetical protein